MRGRVREIYALGLAVAAVAAAPAALAAGVTERVSVGPGGVQADSSSFGQTATSANGRFIVFRSNATNLVPGDTNSELDVFVRDRQSGKTRRVNVGPGGAQSDGFVQSLSISGDGRFVAFASGAENLLPGPDRNPDFDVFVHDLQTRTTRLASVGPGGVQGNRFSSGTALSADGRFVAFSSVATNLVPGDTNDELDVFVRDLKEGVTRRVSVGPRGVQANNGSGSPSISANGRFVAFRSDATNLVPGDTNGEPDVFVHDLEARRTVRASVGTGGVEGNGDSEFGAALSADGRYVAFTSESTNLVPGDTNGERDIYVRDLKAGTTRRASVGPGGVGGNRESRFPTISANGRFVAFDSRATNLVPGDTNGEFDVFVRDLEKGKTIRISTSTGGAQGDNRSIFGTISADGRVVVFDSDATNLVRGDTNGARDVFVRVPPVP